MITELNFFLQHPISAENESEIQKKTEIVEKFKNYVIDFMPSKFASLMISVKNLTPQSSEKNAKLNTKLDNDAKPSPTERKYI